MDFLMGQNLKTELDVVDQTLYKGFMFHVPLYDCYCFSYHYYDYQSNVTFRNMNHTIKQNASFTIYEGRTSNRILRFRNWVTDLKSTFFKQ